MWLTASDRSAIPRGQEPIMSNEEFFDADAACRFIGGSRPINAATLYRGVKAGIYPAPIKVAPNISRWLKTELEVAIAKRIAERDDALAAAGAIGAKP
jgi:predicted DNA-binding transcriptional regulator AlpA